MRWQVNYALKYISEISGVTTAQHLRDEAILIRMPSKPEAIAVISAATLVDIDAARQYYLGTSEKGIHRLDPNTANERRDVFPGAWL